MRRASWRIQLFLTIVFVLLTCTAAHAEPPRYSLTNLYEQMGQGWVWGPLKLNNTGQIMDEVYLWTPGEPAVRLDFVGADLNDHGVVVGSTRWCCDPSAKAVRWSPALGLQEIGDGRAQAINNTGQI